jgi:hypothetical protein
MLTGYVANIFVIRFKKIILEMIILAMKGTHIMLYHKCTICVLMEHVLLVMICMLSAVKMSFFCDEVDSSKLI